MTLVKFRTATVEFAKDKIVATFNDGKVNILHHWEFNDENIQVAKQYGYNDPFRYMLEHELAHHFIADNLGMKHSWCLYTGADEGPTPHETWPNHIAWEENLVNALQHYAQKGKRDKWNTLHCVFTEKKLARKTDEFKQLAFKVLDAGIDVEYNYETGFIRKLKHEPVYS